MGEEKYLSARRKCRADTVPIHQNRTVSATALQRERECHKPTPRIVSPYQGPQTKIEVPQRMVSPQPVPGVERTYAAEHPVGEYNENIHTARRFFKYYDPKKSEENEPSITGKLFSMLPSKEKVKSGISSVLWAGWGKLTGATDSPGRDEDD